MLSEQTDISEHTIKLIRTKQPSYKAIYSLDFIKLEIFKTYIKINLANDFIQFLKYPAGTFIFLIYKLDNSFYYCIDH